MKGKDSIDCAGVLNNIGRIVRLQGNYKMALEYLEKSLSII